MTRHALTLAALLCLSCAVQAWCVTRAVTPAQDAVRFIRIAEAIQREGLLSILRTREEHPGFPAMVWLAHHGRGRSLPDTAGAWTRSAQLAATASLVLAVVSVYGLLLCLTRWPAAAAGAVFFCVMAPVARLGADGLSDSTHLCLLCAALWAAARWFRGQKPGIGLLDVGRWTLDVGRSVQTAERPTSNVQHPTSNASTISYLIPSPVWLFLAGLFLSLAALVRKEALVLPVAIGLAAIVIQLTPWRRRWRRRLGRWLVSRPGDGHRRGSLPSRQRRAVAAAGNRPPAGASAERRAFDGRLGCLRHVPNAAEEVHPLAHFRRPANGVRQEGLAGQHSLRRLRGGTARNGSRAARGLSLLDRRIGPGRHLASQKTRLAAQGRVPAGFRGGLHGGGNPFRRRVRLSGPATPAAAGGLGAGLGGRRSAGNSDPQPVRSEFVGRWALDVGRWTFRAGYRTSNVQRPTSNIECSFDLASNRSLRSPSGSGRRGLPSPYLGAAARQPCGPSRGRQVVGGAGRSERHRARHARVHRVLFRPEDLRLRAG